MKVPLRPRFRPPGMPTAKVGEGSPFYDWFPRTLWHQAPQGLRTARPETSRNRDAIGMEGLGLGSERDLLPPMSGYRGCSPEPREK